MSAALLDGKALSARMRGRLGQEAAARPRQPGLAVVLVGEDSASQVYVRGKEADCGDQGAGYRRCAFACGHGIFPPAGAFLGHDRRENTR